MPKFTIHVVRDASVTFTATVEAADLAEVEANMGKHGYQGEIVGDWIENEPSTYDGVEQYRVEDAAGKEIYEQDWN